LKRPASVPADCRYNGGVRLFYASFLSTANMQAYQAMVDGLNSDLPGVLRSIPPKSHHLTLAFLGEIADSDVDKCTSALQAVERVEAFPISLSQPRILKGRGRPRLVCVDITDGSERVSGVQATLIAHLSKSLPALDLRIKPAHVTLARFNKNARAQQARVIDEATAKRYDDSLPWKDRFASVRLMKSSLTSSGPIYKTVAEAHLGIS
jgi:2'-5' RNA ligase